MHPILFEFGSLKIPTYGVILVTAFLIAMALVKVEARRMHLPVEALQDLALWVLIGGLVGAKLLYILLDLPYYIENPHKLWDTIQSAGVLYGGVILGIGTAVYLIRKHNLPLWNTLDLFAPLLAMGIGIGRLGCFFAGCCHGKAYSGPLSVVYPASEYCSAPSGIEFFPIQLVAVVDGLLLFAFLFWLARRRKFQGQIAALFMLLYGIVRFIEEFFRGDTGRGLWFNDTISTSQIIAIGMILAAILIFSLKRNAHDQ
ncbi:MAG: prolipoprotein diacylglyceryl transferase [Acidobacteria bacterium]|nr:MAG: prolipoprotein diacylglyceryl transferase [Acidobacteriota bacterium]